MEPAVERWTSFAPPIECPPPQEVAAEVVSQVASILRANPIQL